MAYDAYIFDLDGTLLDTLPDLTLITNMVLEEFGWPKRTSEEVVSFVGNGGRVLIDRAAPAGTSDDQLDEAFARWCELYPVYGHALTKPYPGIPEALDELKRRGAKLGVLSNKFDGATQVVIADQFPGVFHFVRGECTEVPRKPDPTGLRFAMSQLGVQPDRVAYVGDSPSDMTVANRADTYAVGVSWGYRSVPDLLEAGAGVIIDRPSDLLDL